MTINYSYEAVAAQLKQALRKRKVSYGQLADRIGLSESGVKKLMTSGDMTMSRLSDICHAADIDLFDLIEASWKTPPAAFRFSDEQIAFFESHRDHYNFYKALFDAHLDTDMVKQEYSLDDQSITLYLASLEYLGLITVTPGGKLTSVVPRPYRMASPGQADHANLVEYLNLVLYKRERKQRRVLKAQLRMTQDHYDDFKIAVRDVIVKFGLQAEQDELSVANKDLVDVGILAALAQCRTRDFVSIPKLRKRATD